MDNKEITREISNKYEDFIKSIESEYNVSFQIMTSLSFEGVGDPAVRGGCVIASVNSSKFIELSINAISKYPPFFKEMNLLVLRELYNSTIDKDVDADTITGFGDMPSTEELGDLLNDLNDN